MVRRYLVGPGLELASVLAVIAFGGGVFSGSRSPTSPRSRPASGRGRSEAALRRCARYGDGWLGVWLLALALRALARSRAST